MDMNVHHGHEPAGWTLTCNGHLHAAGTLNSRTDMDMQHGSTVDTGHAAWIRSTDMDMQHVCIWTFSLDMDMDMQQGY